MLTLKDCTDYCGLNEEQLEVIASSYQLSPIQVCALVSESADYPYQLSNRALTREQFQELTG